MGLRLVGDGSGTQKQLTFDVLPHVDLRGEDEQYLAGALKLAGDFHVAADLNPGELLYVTVADADGRVLAQERCKIGAVGFAPIENEGRVIGMERIHRSIPIENEGRVIGMERIHRSKVTHED